MGLQTPGPASLSILVIALSVLFSRQTSRKQAQLTSVVDVAPNVESIERPTQPNTYGMHAQKEKENSKAADADVSAIQPESPSSPRASAFATGYARDAHDANQHHSDIPARISATFGPRLTPETSEHLSNPNHGVARTPANDTGERSNTGKEPGGYLSLLY